MNGNIQHPYPSIFTKKYFENILNKLFGSSKQLKILDLQISPCNGTGEGFLSSLYRISIKYIHADLKIIQKISVITKSECTNEFSLEKVGENGLDVQNKEIKFFQKIYPKLLKVFDQNASKTFPYVIEIDKKNKILIFEDLQDLNYKMADRINGMNEAHAKMSLKKFAQFHAATLKVLENDPKAFDEFQTGMFSQNFNQFDDAIVNSFQTAVDEISTWKGYEKYGRKMSKITDVVVENLKKCFDLNSDDLNLLIHGDLWTTNLMFKYDKDDYSPTDLVLIDFQFSQYGSAALDLIRFFFTSINDELYNPKDIQRLLKFYHEELLKNVKKFQCIKQNFPSYDKFLAEFNSKLYFGFVYNIVVFPVMTTDDPDNDFITHHMNNERSKAFRRRVMKAERYQKIVKRMLPFYDEIGII